MTLSLICLGLGFSMFFASWFVHDRFDTTKEIYLETGKFAGWLIILGIIFLSAGV